MKIYKCPKCGEVNRLHFNYDLTKQHRPVLDVLCNMCGEFFDGDMPVAELLYKHTEGKGFSAYLKTTDPRVSDDFQIGPDGAYEHTDDTMWEKIAEEQFKHVGDEGLFPNHTDKDIWISGFVAAMKQAKPEYPELEGTMNLCNDIIEKKTGKMTEEEWQAAEKAQTSTKTSIEWLVEQIIRKHPIITQFLPNYNFDKEIIEQAKLLHKQEIEDAFQDGKWDWSEHINNGTESKDLAQYYQETFKKD
jgi:hypothetical protein